MPSQPLELWEITSCCLNHPGYGILLWHLELTNIAPLPRTTPRGQSTNNDWLIWESKGQPPCLKVEPTLQYNSCFRAPQRDQTPDETTSLLGDFPSPILLPRFPPPQSTCYIHLNPYVSWQQQEGRQQVMGKGNTVRKIHKRYHVKVLDEVPSVVTQLASGGAEIWTLTEWG